MKKGKVFHMTCLHKGMKAREWLFAITASWKTSDFGREDSGKNPALTSPLSRSVQL